MPLLAVRPWTLSSTSGVSVRRRSSASFRPDQVRTPYTFSARSSQDAAGSRSAGYSKRFTQTSPARVQMAKASPFGSIARFGMFVPMRSPYSPILSDAVQPLPTV